jgi:hypothetical protein
MLKTLRVPAELIALSQVQRATTREVGSPLYLPAYEDRLLGPDPIAETHRERDVAGAFEIVTIGGEDDDDFY